MVSRWVLFRAFVCSQEHFLDANAVADVFRELEMVDYEGKLSIVPCGCGVLSFRRCSSRRWRAIEVIRSAG